MEGDVFFQSGVCKGLGGMDMEGDWVVGRGSAYWEHLDINTHMDFILAPVYCFSVCRILVSEGSCF